MLLTIRGHVDERLNFTGKAQIQAIDQRFIKQHTEASSDDGRKDTGVLLSSPAVPTLATRRRCNACSLAFNVRYNVGPVSQKGQKSVCKILKPKQKQISYKNSNSIMSIILVFGIKIKLILFNFILNYTTVQKIVHNVIRIN